MISSSVSSSGGQPNDLLDARNETVRQLSTFTGAQVVEREGNVDIYLGSGQPLVIDPVLVYSTYLGGSGYGGFFGDSGNAIAVDSAGNVFVTGWSRDDSGDFGYATVAYSGAGVPLWTNRYDGPGPGGLTANGNGSGSNDGHGLEGLAERARLVHGHVEAGAQPGGGYRLAVTVPATGSGSAS